MAVQPTAKPPLVVEIERLAREIQVERTSEVIDFAYMLELQARHRELVAWARVNGWGSLPSDDRPPPAAPAATLRAAA